MTTKVKVAAGLVVVVGSFAAGRYSNQKPEVHTVINTEAETKKDSNKDTQTHQVSVSVKAPDGTIKTTTTTDTSTIAKTDTITDSTTHMVQTIIPPKNDTLNISVLAGIDFSRQVPIYGASLTKQVLGPLTIGVFGLTNGIMGGSIGVQF